MKVLNYAHIVCPVSGEPINECECQNCVIARMEDDYRVWVESERIRLAARIAGLSAFVLVAVFFIRMATR